jgi:hypothetical protein
VRCAHVSANWSRWEDGAWVLVGHLSGMPLGNQGRFFKDRLVCDRCGYWIGLGDSNDAPDAVRVEMRAAELAALLPDSFDETMMEWAGRCHFVEGHEMPTTFGGLAGWLAAAIATHHAPQPADAGGDAVP